MVSPSIHRVLCSVGIYWHEEPAFHNHVQGSRAHQWFVRYNPHRCDMLTTEYQPMSLSAVSLSFCVMYVIPFLWCSIVQADTSGHRQTEVLDNFTETTIDTVQVAAAEAHRNDIGFGRAEFSWSREDHDGSQTPSTRRTFRLRIEGEVAFKQGGFNLIVGPTGSGKTSVLMALLGEMHYIPLAPDSWANLPRHGGVAYAAQESWVQNETIKVLQRYPHCPSLVETLRRKIFFLALPTTRSATSKVTHFIERQSWVDCQSLCSDLPVRINQRP